MRLSSDFITGQRNSQASTTRDRRQRIYDTIDYRGDTDTWRFWVQGGRNVTVRVNGTRVRRGSTVYNPLRDPYVSFRSPGGFSYSDDDSGPGLNAARTYFNGTTGWLYVTARSATLGPYANGTGGYSISVTY